MLSEVKKSKERLIPLRPEPGFGSFLYCSHNSSISYQKCWSISGYLCLQGIGWAVSCAYLFDFLKNYFLFQSWFSSFPL